MGRLAHPRARRRLQRRFSAGRRRAGRTRGSCGRQSRERSRPAVAAPSPRPTPPLRVAAPSPPGRPSRGCPRPPVASPAQRAPTRRQSCDWCPARAASGRANFPAHAARVPAVPPPPAPAARGAELRWRRRPRWRRKRRRQRRRRPLQPHTQSPSWRSDGSPTPGGEWPERRRGGSATSPSLAGAVGTGWRARAPGTCPAGRSDGLGASREGRREREREVSGGPGISCAGRPRSVNAAAVAAEKSTFYSVSAFR